MADPFKAFISYSRGASQPLAADLQSGLERFAKPWYRLRNLRVFRDDSSMSANTALWSTIETGLTQSEWFILLATPASAVSEWVSQEIEWWLRTKGSERLLIVQADGELYWDRQQRCFHPASTAIPPILRTAYREEPRWIDMRWYAADPVASRADPRFAERVADLAAAIHGVERDTLVGENVRQHRRALRLARAGVAALAVLLVLSIVAGVVAVAQRGVAIQQRDAAERESRIAQARALAATARSLAETDVGAARLLAVQAFRLSPEVQTASALLDTVTASPQLVRELDAGARVWSTAATPDGRLAFASNADGAVFGWDLSTGARTELGRIAGLPGDLEVSDDGRVVATQSSVDLSVWIDGRPVALPALPAPPAALALSRSGNTLVVGYGDQTTAAVLRRNGDGFELSSTTIRFGAGAFQLAMDGEGSVSGWLYPGGEGRVEHRSVTTGRLLSTGGGATGADRLGGALSPDGRYLSALEVSNTGTASVFRTDHDYGGGDGARARADLIAYAPGGDDPQIALSQAARLSAYAVNQVIYVAPTQAPGSKPFQVRELRGITRTGVNSLTFAGQRYLLSGADDRLMVWDLQQNTLLARSTGARIPSVPTYAVSRRLVVNASGSRAVLLGEGSGFTIIDTADGSTLAASETSAFLAWKDDDRLFYADAADTSVHVFDAATGREVGRWPLSWPLREGSRLLDVWSAVYVPGDDELLIAGTRLVAGFRAGDGAPGVRRDDLSYPTFSADGRFVFGVPEVATPRGVVDAVAGGQRHDVAAGLLELDPRAAEQAGMMLSGYQGNTLVTQSKGALERVFWTTDGSAGEGTAPAGVDFASFRIAVDAAGKQYAIHRGDDTIEIADLRSGTSLVRVPISFDDSKASFGYAGDGRQLLVALPEGVDPGYPEGLVLRVDLRPETWVAIACRTAARDLTAEEWRRVTGADPPADLRCR